MENNNQENFWIRFKKDDHEVMLIIHEPIIMCEALERFLQVNGVRYTRTDSICEKTVEFSR